MAGIRQMKHPIIIQLKNKRLSLKLTQKQIAERLGTHAGSICRLEEGKDNTDHSPSLNRIDAYAKALGGRIEYKFVEK